MRTGTFMSARVSSIGRSPSAQALGRCAIEGDREFHLAGRPIPVMGSINAVERVIYANGFACSPG